MRYSVQAAQASPTRHSRKPQPVYNSPQAQRTQRQRAGGKITRTCHYKVPHTYRTQIEKLQQSNDQKAELLITTTS